jgi:hypothetical protein
MRMARLIASSSVQSGQWRGNPWAPSSFRDGLVLEVAEDVAVLAVELADAAQPAQDVHGLGDELVGDHALGPLLVGHEELEGGDAHLEGS